MFVIIPPWTWSYPADVMEEPETPGGTPGRYTRQSKCRGRNAALLDCLQHAAMLSGKEAITERE